MTLPKPKKPVDEQQKLADQKEIRQLFKKGLTPRDVCRVFNPRVVEVVILEAIHGSGTAQSEAINNHFKLAEIDKIKGAKAPLKMVPITMESAQKRELEKAEKIKAAQG